VEVAGRTPASSPGGYGLPTKLGDLTLVERFGVGGMAEVFRATRPLPTGGDGTVVVKRCLPHLAEDRRFVEMFLREARNARRLRHKNVVQVHELGHIGNSYFLVMEFVDGLTLRKLAVRAWSRRRALPMELVTTAIADAALGLHYAHTVRDEDGNDMVMVHRDVSPENLMIDRDGATKVLDFGIARTREGGMRTKTGELKGKIPFMSPEHIKGGAIDGRSDVYALGVTMYWLLTGRRPHRAPTELALLNEILFTPVPPPSSINAQIPPALDALVMSMLARDLERRPESALVVYDSLSSSLGTRNDVVSPFMREVLSLPELAERGPLSEDEEVEPGFTASAPQTNVALCSWRAEHPVDEPTERPPEPTDRPDIRTEHHDGTEPTLGGVVTGIDAAPSRRLVAAGVALAALTAIGIGFVLLSGAPTPVVVDAGPTIVDAPAPVPPTPTPADVVPTDADPTPVDPPRATDGMVRVQLKGPSSVSFSVGKSAGKPGHSVDVSSKQRVLRAVDRTTGCVHMVPIVAGVADFAKLGSGTLDVRALPYAAVKLGPLSLGTTPFAPHKIVEGTCEVTLTFETRIKKQTVKIVRGQQKRIQVDLRK
jgi:serine/threonine-protein kinase